MLLWEFLFIFLLCLVFWSFIFSSTTLFSVLLNSEFIVIIFFCLFLNASIFFNTYLLVGLSYLYLILGGLELALNILLLLI